MPFSLRSTRKKFSVGLYLNGSVLIRSSDNGFDLPKSIPSSYPLLGSLSTKNYRPPLATEKLCLENKMAVAVFSVPVFLVVFRETIEAGIIISVLLAFLKQTLGSANEETHKAVYKSLLKQVSFQWQTSCFLLSW